MVSVEKNYGGNAVKILAIIWTPEIKKVSRFGVSGVL